MTTTNQHDTDAALLEQARGLTPTEGVWNWSEYPSALRIGDYHDQLIAYANRDDVRVRNQDDATLIRLAPDLRALALRQADELAALKFQLYEKDDHVALLQAQVAKLTFERDNALAAYRIVSNHIDTPDEPRPTIFDQ